MMSRKRTRSTTVSESNNDHEQGTSSSTIVSSLPTNTVPPKRQRNNPPSGRTTYPLRNHSLTPDSGHLSSIDTSTNSRRYNLRPRRPQSQIDLSQVSSTHSTVARRRIRRQIPPVVAPTIEQSQPTPSIVQPRQYRLVYISDDDDQPTTTTTLQPPVNSTYNLVTDDENSASIRPQNAPRRTSRSTSGTGLTTRSRAVTDPSTMETPEFSNGGVAHVRLNRAIEIVIDSIQSLEGAVNNFDQLVFGLIYGRLSTRTEYESIEGMIRLSRILNLNFPSRLTQAEIDALPKMKFSKKSDSTLLIEKCPICLNEFNEQELINKLHCTHLFHLQCISTWLSENDSCPTCRRKVNGD